ncbi:MAG: hypothetical protein Q9159_000588 [Coniocarpon cinnabarinum]
MPRRDKPYKGDLRRSRAKHRLNKGMRDASGQSPAPSRRDGPSRSVSRSVSRSRKGDRGNDTNANDSNQSKPEPKDDRFYHVWDKFTQRQPLPSRSRIAGLDEDVVGKHRKAAGRNRDGLASRENAATSFEEAAETCRKKVRAIVAECKRLNKKYHDPMFDLLSRRSLVSLTGLVNGDPHFIGANNNRDAVADVKRVGDIFDNPQFFVDGATANDVRQSMYAGDCWFLASVTALLGKPENIERLCVDRDEQVGVYGFCFHRDGEWISAVVDDKLCVRFHEDQRHCLLSFNPDNTKTESALPEKFLKSLPKGPDSLYFASCKSDNETWLPLLEKAYAKAHLSYQSTEGGWTGEGIEDLTGGVNSTMYAEDILDKDAFWAELERANTDFLFGCGSKIALYADQDSSETKGVVTQHAYTVLTARTVKVKDKDAKDKDGKPTNQEKTVRLLKVRNPWGDTEWTGAWSDGSKEWTPDTMRELDHTFGDDGIFWISLEDFLKAYPQIDRTRLFGPEWTIAQQWTTVSVPRSVNYSDTDYLPTTFNLHITKPGPVCIMLSQPDDRYFEALRGRYSFELHFRVYKEGGTEYLVRSMSSTASGRSVSVELDCEPGTYVVRLKLTPWRYDSGKTAAEIIKDFETYDIEKILSVGKMFDLAHSRGRLREMEIAEMKRMKKAARERKHGDMRAIRELQRARRRRGKTADQRIKRREREKRQAKKAAKQERKQAAARAAEEKAEEDKGRADDSANKTEEQATSGQPLKDAKVEPEAQSRAEDTVSDGTKPALNVQGENAESVSPSDSAVDMKTEEASSSQIEATSPAIASNQDAPIANGKAVVVTIRTKDDKTQEPPNEPKDAETKDADAKQPIPNNGPSITVQQDPPPPENEEDEDDDWTSNVSDVGSVAADDFPWDSDIDGSVDEDDFDVGVNDGEEDLFSDDDWFALATIGLRLYSMDAEASISVEWEDRAEEVVSRATTM